MDDRLKFAPGLTALVRLLSGVVEDVVVGIDDDCELRGWGDRWERVGSDWKADYVEVALLDLGQPIEDLAREAVSSFEQDFYDYDGAQKVYGTETVSCPRCGDELENLSRACIYCRTRYPEGLSRNRQVHEAAVAVVQVAIAKALLQSRVRVEVQG